MRDDLFVYVSGPITPKNGHTEEENISAAIRVYVQLLRAGIPAYCPHVANDFPSNKTLDYEAFMYNDFMIIRRCTHILLMPRWQESAGTMREAEYAGKIGVATVYLPSLDYDMLSLFPALASV